MNEPVISYLEGMAKLAGKHTSKNYAGNSFSYASDKEMLGGIKRQGGVRAMMGIDHKANTTRGVNPHRSLKYIVNNANENLQNLTPIGTYAHNKHQDRPVVMIHRDRFKSLDPVARRMALAHEAFHARTPILGHSEIAAHMYGGFKANKGFKKIWNSQGGEHTPLGTGAVNQFGYAVMHRPIRATGELALAGGAAYGGYKLYKKLREKFGNKPNDQTSKVS